MKQSMKNYKKSMIESATIIADNMIALRPKEKIKYIPRKCSDYIRDEATLGMRKVDLYKLFPNASKGDWAYVSVKLQSNEDFDAALVVTGAQVVYINGVEYQIIDDEKLIYFKMSRVGVLLEFKCVADKEFGVGFVPSLCYYPRMLAKDYLHHISMNSPQIGYEDEEGVAVSALCGERGIYTYPKPREQTSHINFNELYSSENGAYAYAVMFAEEDCNAEFNIQCKSTLTIFSGGVKMVKRTNGGKIKLDLNKNDMLFIKCERAEKWGFEFEGRFYLPFLDKKSSIGCEAAVIGSFGKPNTIDTEYPPEIDLDFVKPYKNFDLKTCFFKLPNGEDYITADLNTNFYAQWFYALMVGEYGLLDAYKLTGDKKYQQYFIDSMTTITDFYELQQWQKSIFGESAFLQRGMNPQDLDSIGAIGMNLCELYSLTKSRKAMSIIEKLIAAINVIPRFDDGTFHRGEKMWADDIYMSCPFMLRYGILKGEDFWLEECIRQMLGFKKRLFIEKNSLFSHIYYVNEGEKNCVPWGRGNGWVFITLSELIEKLPKHLSGYNEMIKLYQEFAKGILAVQGTNGLWHQVLDDDTSYEETSCTGMFIIGLCRGIRMGIIDDSVLSDIDKAIEGLMEYKIDSEGNLYDVCRGSCSSKDSEYYANLGTNINDDHGTGIILSALYERSMIKKRYN